MYFNIWSNENYILKWIFLLLLLFLIIFIIINILVQAYKKYKKNYNKKQEKKLIINIINSNKDEEEKFNKIKEILWLDSSYKLAIFLNVDNKEILDLIKEKKYSIINTMIYNHIINKYD